MAASVVTPEGKVLSEVRYPTATTGEKLLENLARAIREVSEGFEVGGVCLAAAGTVLAAENKVITSPNLHAVEGIPLKEELEERTGLATTVENDANAAAWGEFRFGAGAAVNHLVFLTLGTGIGGGVVINGEVLRGAQGAGGEMGHVTIQPTGPKCGCGNRGCLEALASGNSIGLRARKYAKERPDSALGRLAAERELFGKDVAELANAGDEAARGILEEAGRWLGIGVMGFVNVFNPEVVAIGGGASAAGDLLLDPARQEVKLRAMSPNRDLVEIKEATLGPGSGTIGAAALARDASGAYVLGS